MLRGVTAVENGNSGYIKYEVKKYDMTAPETRKTPRGRTTVPVRRRLEHRLFAYAAAAGASLVTVQPAAAKVIYTSTNLTIETGILPLDLNHDGVVDFNLVDRATSTSLGGGSRYLDVNGPGNPLAGVARLGVGYRSVRALPLGTEIGPDERFLKVQNVAGRMVSRWLF